MGNGLPDDWFIEHTGESRILDQDKVAAEIARLRAALTDAANGLYNGFEPDNQSAGYTRAIASINADK